MDWDHVFPVSWYPDSSPANEAKWKIPSCIPCNQAYGRLEEDFLNRVGLCLNPDDDASRSIVEKVLRGLDPSSAKSDRDRRARVARRLGIISDTLQGAEIPHEATYPGMHEKWDRPLDEQIAVTIPAEYFQRITEKIVRGVSFIENRRLIEPPFEIENFVIDDSAAQSIRDSIARFGKTYARPPGLIVGCAVVPDDGMSSLWEITFWGQFKSYASVLAPH
jgi:hypothetical protein